MSDKTKKGGGGSKGRPPQDRGPRRGPSRPFRDDSERGERRPRRDDERSARPRREEGERPVRARREETSERPGRDRRDDGGARPYRSRGEGGERSERPERSVRPRRDRDEAGGADRPARPFRPRPEGERGERPFRARRDDASGGGDRPFRPRRDRDEAGGGERPARPFRPRSEGERSERPFRPRREDRQRSAFSPAGERPKKEYAERIAKVIARAGLCSRRDAEAWIEAGRVTVNGEVLASPALDVTAKDRITVDGQPLPTRERTRLFLYHKPRGLVTTARDPEGRPTVFGALPPGLPRVVTIGRLDINTEGLLLLTNDGGLSRVIELPDTGWLRRYRVRAYGEVTQADLDALAGGVTIDDMHYGPVEAEMDREQGDNVWLTLGLREGKNREVKRILEHLGLQVNRLIRLSFGPFQLGDLPEGAVEEVSTRVLADQLGPELAAQAGVDFDAPVFVYEEDDFRPKKREDRPQKREREGFSARGERPSRPYRDRDEGDAPRRSRFRDDESQREEAPAPKRPARRSPLDPARSVWRADAPEPGASAGRKVPRRGADPKAARSESATREHVRAGKVQSRSGKAVLVERVARDPAAPVREERPVRRPRRDDAPAGPSQRDDARPRRSAWDEGEERPRRPSRPAGERPDRPPRRDRDGERPGGDRPFRGKPGGNRTGGDRPAGDRPRGGRSGGGGPGGGRPGGGRPGGAGGPRRPRRDD